MPAIGFQMEEFLKDRLNGQLFLTARCPQEPANMLRVFGKRGFANVVEVEQSPVGAILQNR